MTGSASMRWTFLVMCESLLKGRGLGKGGQSDSLGTEAGGLLQNDIYIYIYSKNQLFGRSEKERFLDRFSMIF